MNAASANPRRVKIEVRRDRDSSETAATRFESGDGLTCGSKRAERRTRANQHVRGDGLDQKCEMSDEQRAGNAAGRRCGTTTLRPAQRVIGGTSDQVPIGYCERKRRHLFDLLVRTTGRDVIGRADINRVGVVVWSWNRFLDFRCQIVVMVPVPVRIVVMIMVVIAAAVSHVEVRAVIVVVRLTFVVGMAVARQLTHQERRHQQQR